MPRYRIKAPNGQTYQIEGPEGATQDEVIAEVLRQHPDAGQAPDPNKSGFTAAASAGIERLKGEAALLSGKLGLMSEEEAQAYKEEKDRAAQARFTPTQEGWLDAPWLKLKETAGGSVPYMAAPLAVGAAATGLGAPGVAAALLGGAASAAQFTGSNLRAQMDTGKSLKETDAGAAALAAIPQAALDTLSFRMMPGIGKMFGAAGAQVTEEAAKKIAEQSLKKVAADYALSTGKTMGVEGLTEAAQQVFERLQAGLQINDPEARKDYLENFIGGAALAAVLGPLGRYQERGQIKRFGQEKEDERRREELLAKGEKKEETTAPELDMATAFPRAQELQAQINALRAQKVAKPKDELEKARNAQIEKEVKALVAELTPLAQFVAKNRNAAPAPAAAPVTTADKGPGLFGEMPVPEQPEKNLLGGELQRAPVGETLTDEENAAAARSADTRVREDGRPWTRDELETQWNTIEDSINTLRERARSETDVNALRSMADQVKRLEAARRPLDEALGSMPEQPLPPSVEKVGRSEAALQTKIKRLQKQADDAGENGDVAARLRALEKLQALQQNNAQMGLFTPDAQATRDAQASEIGQEVGAVREQRESERRAYEQRQQEDTARAARLKQLLAQADAATSAQEERRLRAEIESMQKGRLDTSRTEQMTFDEEVSGPRVVSGAGVENTRERLLYELQKARAARALAGTRGDRDARSRATRAAEIALENLREFDTREQTEKPASTTGGELAETLGGTRQPNTLDTRPGLIDARTRAFREYVSLLDRFNRGRGDLAGLKDAENTIIENLIKEAEQARGKPLSSGEKTVAIQEAREMLRELKDRFGDTRSDIDIGTRDNPNRIDETLLPAYGSQAARSDMGISRFESQDPGYRTFGNRYAAADSILEGLDEISNRLSSTTGGARVERSMTPAEVSPERLRQMVAAAKPKLQGEDAALLDQIDANLPAIQKAGPRRSAAVAQWLYKRVNGLAATEDAQEVRNTLAELEQGKRSETEGDTRAVQGEMFPGTQDNVFDSFAEFDEALASPELAQIRKDLGLAGQTASAAAQQVSKVQAEIDRITREINAATALEADIKAQPQRTMEEAQALSTGVQRDLLGLYREIDIVLAPFQNQYEKAVQAVLQAQARSLRLAEALQQNFDGMEEFQTASIAAQSDAMRAVEQAKRRLKATIDLMVRQRQETFDALAQLTTSTSLDAYKTFAQGRDFGEDLQRQAVAAHADLIRAQRGVQGLPPTADKMQAFLRQDFELRRELRSAQARIGGLTTARNRLNNMRQDAYQGVFTDEVRQEVFRRERDLAVAQQIVADARAGVDRTAQEVREMLTPMRGELEDQRRALQREVRTTEAEVQARRETPARGAAARERVDENARMAARDAGYREEQARLERAAGPQQTADGERVLDEAGGKAEGAASTLGARRVTFPDRAEKKFTSTKYLRLLNRSLDDSITAEERQQAKDDLAELVLRATKAEQAVAKRIDALVDARQKKVEQIAEHKKEYPNRVKEREKMQRSLRMLENKLQTARGTEITDIPTRAEQRRAKADLDRETRGMPAASADEVSAEIASTQKTRRVTSPVMEDVRTKRKFESTKETKERKPVGKAKQFRPREELAYRREQLDTINARLENEASGPAGARLLDAKKRLQERIQQLEAKLGKSATAAEVDVGDALYQRGQQVDGEALSDTAVQALEADNIAAALNNVVQTSKTPINRAVARRLRSLLGNTRVILEPNLTNDKGEPVLGAASGDGMTIWLNPNGGLNEETLLHEAVHAATERVLRTPDSQLTSEQVAAKRELQALFARVKADPSFTSVDAKASLSEFVAEAMTNPVLQAQLARKPWKLQNAWEGFKRVLLKLLGVTTPPGDMLTASLAAVDTIMQAPRPGEVEGGTRAQKQRESIIASPRTAGDAIKSNAGLAFRTQAIDRLAPAEKVASYLKDPADGMQAMYYLRTYGQRMSLVSQAVSNGAPQLVEKQRSDGKKEWLIESQKGANLKDVMDELKSAGIKDSQKLERLFTLDLVGRRAANVGWDKLDFENPDAVKAEVTQAREEIQALGARDAFNRAAKLYNMFNKDMLKFMVQTGAISKESYDALSKNGDYVPFYRQRGGNAELVIGKETPVRIGNLKDSPHLRELIGGSDKILPFSASAVQNVSLLTDLAVRNIGTRNLAFEMASMGLGKIGKGDAKGTNVFTFKDDGVDKYMILDEEAMDNIGVPADLMVKGLAGIPTMLPAAMRLLALPSQLLRKSITLSPVYAVRQLFRDSTAAAIVSGANITPVFSALKQLGRKSATQSALERRGITGGQVFTGTGEDISKILRDIGAGKNPMRLLAWLEARSMEADASTRRAQYDSYRKQGLSEMEATMMSLESMNFTRQGLSPSIHMVGQLVPFMNAQIQGLDVLYRAITGKMPMNERLGIQRKMMVRGALLASLTLAYAYAMQDDPAYKNATPEERAMNWFVRIPGLDEPVRIPIPFEIGYIFKAMPEAVMNLALGSQDAKATGQAVNRILINTLPGGSNMLSVPVNGVQIPVPIPMPAAIKPLIEMGTGVSLFTRRPIVSGAQADALPEYQYNERTTEIAKDLGQFFGMSPAIIENTIRGYMSGTGLFIMQAASMAYGDTGGPERATRRMSELPLIGALFQPNDGMALANNVYDRAKEIAQVKATFDNLVKTGERAEAERFLQQRVNELSLSDVAGNAKQMLNRLVQMERAVKASDLSGAEKAEQLKELRRVEIELAASIREVPGMR